MVARLAPWLCSLLLLPSGLAGCDNEPPDADADGDADGDGDSDGGPPDCPRNSGWPCTCDRREPCDDGSQCAGVPGANDDLGVCTALCDPTQPPARRCPATEEFPGSMGLCVFMSDPYQDPTHCLLGCISSSACPSDQRCVDLGIMDELDFCVP